MKLQTEGRPQNRWVFPSENEINRVDSLKIVYSIKAMKSRYLLFLAVAAVIGCSKGASDTGSSASTTGTTTTSTGTTGTTGTTATTGGPKSTGTGGTTSLTGTSGTAGSTATTGSSTPTTASGTPGTGTAAPAATGSTGATATNVPGSSPNPTSTSTGTGPSYTLTLSPANGEVTKYAVKAEVPMAGKGEVDASLKTIYHVANGKIASTVQITSFNADKLFGAIPADQKKQAETALKGMMKSLMAARIKIVQDKTGKVISKTIDGDDQIKGFMQQFGGASNSPLPSKPVKVGDTWTIPSTNKAVSDVSCKLVDVKTVKGKKVAVIGITVSAQDGKISTNGTSTVDLKTGVLITGTSDTKMTGQDGKTIETHTSITKI